MFHRLPLLVLFSVTVFAQFNDNQGQQGQGLFGQQSGQQGGQLSGARPNLKIITDLMEFNNAQPVGVLQWAQPLTQPVYCVADQQGQQTQLSWSCSNCNQTSPNDQAFMQLLQQGREDLSPRTGYSAIKLKVTTSVKLGEIANNKILGCNATVQGGQSQFDQQGYSGSMTLAQAQVQVRYLGKPVIQTVQGSPAMQPDASQQSVLRMPYFLVSTRQQTQLRCNAPGNPQPTAFVWSVGGIAQSGTSFTATRAHFGKTITCTARNAQGHTQTSDPAMIAGMIEPTKGTDNFASVREQGQVVLDPDRPTSRRITLQCEGKGNPRPRIIWQMSPSGRGGSNIRNVTCSETNSYLGQETETVAGLNNQPGGQFGPNAQQGAGGQFNNQPGQNQFQTQQGNQQQSTNVRGVTSRCTVNVENYDYAGSVWCAACTPIAAGQMSCDPVLGQRAGSAFQIQVTGPPIISTKSNETFVYSNNMNQWQNGQNNQWNNNQQWDQNGQQNPNWNNNNNNQDQQRGYPDDNNRDWDNQQDQNNRDWTQQDQNRQQDGQWNPNGQRYGPDGRMQEVRPIDPEDIYAEFQAVYCANPRPEEVYWEVDGSRIDEDSTSGGRFSAYRSQPFGQSDICFRAQMNIKPLYEQDQRSNYVLVARNQVGEMRFDRWDLTRMNGQAVKKTNVALIAGLCALAAVILLCMLIGCCYWRRAACFAPQKKKMPNDSRRQYHTNVAPPPTFDAVRAEPEPYQKSGLGPPSEHGSHYSHNGSLTEKIAHPVGRQPHEGLNYAELDLARADAPPPIPRRPDYDPVDYSYANPSIHSADPDAAGYNPPINSMV